MATITDLPIFDAVKCLVLESGVGIDAARSDIGFRNWIFDNVKCLAPRDLLDVCFSTLFALSDITLCREDLRRTGDGPFVLLTYIFLSCEEQW